MTPRPKTRPTPTERKTHRFDPKLYARAQEKAARCGLTITDVLRSALEDFDERVPDSEVAA